MPRLPATVARVITLVLVSCTTTSLGAAGSTIKPRVAGKQAPVVAADPSSERETYWEDEQAAAASCFNEECCPSHRGCCITPTLWAEADLLWYWTTGNNIPALVTTSPAGTVLGQAGVLGQPNTSVLFGNSELNDDTRVGGRFTLGFSLDPACWQRIGVTYFVLDEESTEFAASASNGSILSRPFFNTQNAAQDARQIVFPNLVTGSISIASSTELQGWELIYRRRTPNVCCQNTELLLGYRFMELEDHLLIRESTTSLAGATAGAVIDLRDQFDTRNAFHGGEFGMATQRSLGMCWSLEAIGKVAIGRTIQIADNSGQTTTTIAGASATTQSGLLVQESNRGRFEEDDIGAIWELNLNLQRQLNCGWTLRCGYSGLLWTDVFRAGEQIDLNVNTSQIPPGTLTGAARPQFPANTDNFWAHGLQVGIARYY